MPENTTAEILSTIPQRILLAEDDPVTQKLLVRLIEGEGFQAVTAKDGEEALWLLNEEADFAAAIFDIQMPNLSGIGVLRYMQMEKRLRAIPVIMITSSNDLELQLQSMTGGSLLFLKKPIMPRSFIQLLATVINRDATKPADSRQ